MAAGNPCSAYLALNSENMLKVFFMVSLLPIPKYPTSMQILVTPAPGNLHTPVLYEVVNSF